MFSIFKWTYLYKQLKAIGCQVPWKQMKDTSELVFSKLCYGVLLIGAFSTLAQHITDKTFPPVFNKLHIIACVQMEKLCLAAVGKLEAQANQLGQLVWVSCYFRCKYQANDM